MFPTTNRLHSNGSFVRAGLLLLLSLPMGLQAQGQTVKSGQNAKGPDGKAAKLAADVKLKKVPESLIPLIESHCFDCHDDETKKGSLDLYSMPFDLRYGHGFETWERVYERMKSGEMPPVQMFGWGEILIVFLVEKDQST